MVRTKVFVGNLDFKTKEAELAKAFSAAGKVISANIITRGPRSLGYGFVEMDSEEDANKAVQLMNKADVDGRPINVEVAKPRDETQQQQPQQQQQQQQQQDSTGAPQEGGRGGFRGRGRGFRGGRGGARGSFRGARGAARGASRGAPRGGRGASRGGRGGNRSRSDSEKGTNGQPQQPDTRTPSKTTLFVANLPFKLDDASFGQVLKDNSLTFKTAHVVTNTRSGRSKGFGFIEFDQEADQVKALNALNKKMVDERELIVKIALTEPNAPEGQDAAPVAAQSNAPQKQ